MWNLERVPRAPDRVHWIVGVLVENVRLCSWQTANNPSFLFGGRARVASPGFIPNVVQLPSVAQWRPSVSQGLHATTCPRLPAFLLFLDFCVSFRVSLSWKPGVSPPCRGGLRFLDLPARFPKLESAYLSQVSIRGRLRQRSSLVLRWSSGGQGLLPHRRIGSMSVGSRIRGHEL